MSDFNFQNLYNQIEQDFANITDLQMLESIRIKYLGRKGILAGLTARIPNLTAQQRKQFGQEVNKVKHKVARLFQANQQRFADTSTQGEMIKKQAQEVDISLAGITQALGHYHLITQAIEEISHIFIRLGFAVVEGPEIETEYNNFTALNIPLEHPSRDVFDTFYIQSAARGRSLNADRLLLRSHTSPVQIRAMKRYKPPLAVIVPGKVYRPDAVDASHSFMFHQIEGFMIDSNVGFSDLKGVLQIVLQSIFGKDIKMRFRPHFFPFTEPSAEVDIACIICQGRGCSVCGQKGWLEILGSGMIHPNVFKHVGYDSRKYTGFAFGMGVERIAMLKYRINDIRLFFGNDLRFLRQF